MRPGRVLACEVRHQSTPVELPKGITLPPSGATNGAVSPNVRDSESDRGYPLPPESLYLPCTHKGNPRAGPRVRRGSRRSERHVFEGLCAVGPPLSEEK